jgi:multidrug resistance efflux pump
VVAAILVVLACAATPLLRWQLAVAQSESSAPLLEASGVIRTEQVSIASEYGGRIASLPLQEGDAVAAGDVLVKLDTALLDAQIAAAQAAVAMAEAGLDQAKAGARPGQVAVAEAQLAQVEAARIAAMQAVSDTLLLVDNPQDIQMQIAVTRQQIKSSQLEIDRALALKDALEIGKDEFKDAQDKIKEAGGPGKHRVQVPGAPPGFYYEYTVPSLPLEMHLIPNQWWQAWIGVNAAAAKKDGQEASLGNLYARAANPQALKAQVDHAIAALAQVEAQVAAAQAQVDGLKAGATEEQIAALEAKVEQARAVLDSLTSQRSRMVIDSPLDGIVIALSAHQGEVAAPGATIATIADLTQVKLTVYLPETQIGRISLGQAVQVAVDSFPGRTFEGAVTHIADSAEFTPRNVATQEERVNLVFAVEISLDNADGALKPGMPADAVFGR